MKDRFKTHLGKKARNFLEKGTEKLMSIKNGIRDDLGIMSTNQRNIWVFNAGDTFTGNPKWLFIYINKYRPDIKAFWLCSNEETVKYINSLGYKAYLYLSEEGIEISTAAGVYVTEQCKEIVPSYLRDCVYLNLFHGVGCKTIERNLKGGQLLPRIMKKYIANNDVFINNQLFLVTSPLMEAHFKSNIGLTDDMVVRGAYPRCVYQRNFEKVATFDHNIRAAKGRDAQTEIVVYAPTFREIEAYDFMGNAIPDMAKLEQHLKENNQLFIFKMHPIMLEKDAHYAQIKAKYENSPYFLFWDNRHDIYEIIDQIDTAIVDYSSIFYDFLAGGVQNFIRYFYDYDDTENIREGAFDYEQMTCGRMCRTFSELICALDDPAPTENEEEERARIHDLFWSYSEEDSMEKIIHAALNFEIKREKLPTLYSFDIFDTLISRKGLHPSSIFCKVKEKLPGSGLGFERHFIDSYIEIRRTCETNERVFRKKTVHVRGVAQIEISLDSIFDRMAALYNLSDEQVAFLKEAEISEEINDTIPIPEMVAYAESLIDKGEDLVLISDMYLPAEVIKKMLARSSEKLAALPLYVSSEYGVQKSTGVLYQEVFKNIEFYKYGQWIHHGDNSGADGSQPRALGIKTEKHTAAQLNDYEMKIVESLGTYDAYLVAAMMARFRHRNPNTRDYFAYAYASLCLVPYSIWVAEDAARRGTDTLYFIARDGYHTQRIADIAIEKLGLDVKTKYIYGSRKAWRIPSFINEFDETFFLPFGNLAVSTTYEEVLGALSLDEEKFASMFPSLCELDLSGGITKQTMAIIITAVSMSEEYRDYLLSVAAGMRVNVDKYLSQQINFDEKFAFVDFWGRGYTQTCFTRLVHNLVGREFDVPYYYLRSIYPTEGYNVRYNYTSQNASMLIAEALCSSNIDYQSVKEYREREDGIVEPVILPQKCDKELLEAMRVRLCEFAGDLLDLDLFDRESTLRSLLSFTLKYYEENETDPLVIENVATLGYALTTYAEEREYAPALTKEDIEIITDNTTPLSHFTNSLPMSLARSAPEVAEYYDSLTEGKRRERTLANRTAAQKRKRTVADFQNRRYVFNNTVKKEAENKAYSKAALKDVKDKVVIINAYGGMAADFAPIVSYYEGKGYKTVILPLKGNYAGKALKEIATAKYIYLSDVTGWFARVCFRKETKLVQMYKEPLPISGMSQTIKHNATKDRIQRIHSIHNVVYDVVSTTGKGVTDVLRRTLVKRENLNRIKAFGHPLTDIYSNEVLKEGIRSKLFGLIPDNGKKLMVYLPYTDKSKHFSYQYLDLAVMKALYGGEYNILVVSNNGGDIISNYASSFSESVYNGFPVLTRREAVAVADIVIGDCSAVVMETVITGKSLFLTSSYTVKEDGSSLFDEEEINVFPLLNDPYDMIPYLDGRSEYDFEAYENFKERFFGACRGNSIVQTDEYLNTL